MNFSHGSKNTALEEPFEHVRVLTEIDSGIHRLALRAYKEEHYKAAMFRMSR